MTALSRKRALLLLSFITAAGAAVRFYGLGWGAPYYHFHIDEHFVFAGALAIRADFFEAANSAKFFMYSPLPMYFLIGLLEAYERIAHPLNVALKQDGITFMILGRSISAALGTATIPLVYLIAERVSGRVAGLVAAALTAAGVLHLRDSHFFSVDVSLTFFSILAWLFLMHVAGSGAIRSYVAAGVAIGAAIACKVQRRISAASHTGRAPRRTRASAARAPVGGVDGLAPQRRYSGSCRGRDVPVARSICLARVQQGGCRDRRARYRAHDR